MTNKHSAAQAFHAHVIALHTCAHPAVWNLAAFMTATVEPDMFARMAFASHATVAPTATTFHGCHIPPDTNVKQRRHAIAIHAQKYMHIVVRLDITASAQTAHPVARVAPREIT